MDVFRTVRLGLEKCKGEVYNLHRGILYENPNPRHDFPSDMKFLIEPQVHSDVAGERPLRELVSEKFLGNKASWEQVALANGGTNALWLSFMATKRREQNVVHVLSPYWMYLNGVIEHSGCEMVDVSTIGGNRLKSEDEVFHELVGTLTPRTSAIYIASPTNPVGNIFSEELVSRLIGECEKRDAHLVVDHAYHGFTRKDPADGVIRPLHAMFRHPRVVNAFTFSKLCGVPGLRLGYVNGTQEVVDRALDWYHYTSYTTNSYSQSVVFEYLKNTALIRNRQEKYKENLAVYDSVMEGVGPAPDGGFFSFVPPQKMSVERLVENGIGVLDGCHFGKGCEGWARLCFTSEKPDRLRTGLQHLRKLTREA